MADLVLETRNLSKSFGNLVATDAVNLTIAKGARHALIGPNGAGKSTLINLLTGVLRPSTGEIFLKGKDVTHVAAHRRVRAGLSRTFQINTLFPDFTPLEAVTLAILQREGRALRMHQGARRQRDAIDEAMTLIEAFGLASDAERPTRDLAYGRQRLLEILLALAAKPEVLLLDEPAAGIPADESAEVFAAIANLPGDVAILFVEHDMELVFRFARTITVLVAGAILCEGNPHEISQSADVRRVYLGSKQNG